MLRGIEVIRVFVSTENVDRIAADAQPRARDQTGIDRISHSCVGRSGAFRSHVAFGSESSHQVSLGRQRRQDGALRNRLLDRLQIFRAGVQEQVNMRVDQARA